MVNMRVCRHLRAFKFKVDVVDAVNSGSPPWMALCEDCSATAFEAMRAQEHFIASRNPRPSAKSSSAVTYSRLKRLFADIA